MSERPVALITGGARGIGAAIVRELSSDHQIAFTYLTSEVKAEALSAEVDGSLAIRADLSEENAPRDIVSATIAEFGRLDVLVNNASAVVAGTVETGSLDAYSKMMSVNAVVPLALIRTALPHLKAGSAIVNVSSVNAQIPPVAAGVFGASKAALEALTVAAAKELGPNDIRVNAVAPGITKVDDVDRPTEMLDKYNSLTPLGRIGEAQEIAKVVRFLATEASSYITGECIRVAGGFGR